MRTSSRSPIPRSTRSCRVGRERRACARSSVRSARSRARRRRRVAEGGDTPVVVDEPDLREFLGRVRFRDEDATRAPIPGLATGLAVTGAGGDVLTIEVTGMEGEPGLHVTGQLGEVMSESAHIALSFVRSHADELGVTPDKFEHKRFHLHVPAGAVPKDGPSAGITMTTALASLLTGRAVKPGVGMTGEVTLQGRVLPIGGLKQKALAAHRAGLTDVVIPFDNEGDLDDVPESVREQVRFHPVHDVREVLDIALGLSRIPLASGPWLGRARSVFLGLDAVDLDLAQEFAGAGVMPALATLLEKGASVETLAPVGFFVGANWPTIYTGTTASRHGFTCAGEIRGGSYDPRYSGPIDDPPPVWQRLSDAGCRVVVARRAARPHRRGPERRPAGRVGLSRPACGHARVSRRQARRVRRASTARTRSGRGRTASWSTTRRATTRIAPAINGPRPRTWRCSTPCSKACSRSARSRWICSTRSDWDLFFAVFGEGHCSGHQFWHVHDEGHPWHDPAGRARPRRRPAAARVRAARRDDRVPPRPPRRRRHRLCAAEPRHAGALRRHAGARPDPVATRPARIRLRPSRMDVPRRGSSG